MNDILLEIHEKTAAAARGRPLRGPNKHIPAHLQAHALKQYAPIVAEEYKIYVTAVGSSARAFAFTQRVADLLGLTRRHARETLRALNYEHKSIRLRHLVVRAWRLKKDA
jgi:hypothetical protein